MTILLLAVLLAGDWPAVRGPTGDGVSGEGGLADRWPSAGPPVVWDRSLGQGYSAVTVVGNRACTHHQTALGQHVVAWDAGTGAEVWSVRLGLPYEPLGIYPGPRATPTVVDGRVHAVTPDAVVSCLAADTGRRIWTVDLDERFGTAGVDFGYSASAVVDGGLVLLPCGGAGAAVVALDAATGRTVWSAGDHPASYCPVVPITLAGRRLVVAYLQNAMTVHEAATGRIVATQTFSQGYDEHAALPLYAEPMLVLSGPFQSGATAYRLAWTDDDTVELTTAWQSREMSNDTASSVLHEGAIYGFDLREAQAKAHRPSRGTFRCLDAATGKVRWSTDRVGHATVLLADGKLVLFVDTGELVLAAADPDEYRELARTAVFDDGVCWTPPALADGLLYLRTQEAVACLDLRTAGAAPATRSAADLRQPRWTSGVGDLLLGGEREHPFEPPDLPTLRFWYLGSLVLAVLPGLLLGCRRRRVRVVWAAAGCVALGIAATPAVNRLADTGFFLSWPATLFGGLLLAVHASEAVKREPASRPARRRARLAGIGLLVLCGGYFWLLRLHSLPHEWVFLLGLFPAALPTLWAVRRRSPLAFVPLAFLAFTVLFWSGPLWQRLDYGSLQEVVAVRESKPEAPGQGVCRCSWDRRPDHGEFLGPAPRAFKDGPDRSETNRYDTAYRSTTSVTGPSLVRLTCMSAPKRPDRTRRPVARAAARKAS